MLTILSENFDVTAEGILICVLSTANSKSYPYNEFNFSHLLPLS